MTLWIRCCPVAQGRVTRWHSGQDLQTKEGWLASKIWVNLLPVQPWCLWYSMSKWMKTKTTLTCFNVLAIGESRYLITCLKSYCVFVWVLGGIQVKAPVSRHETFHHVWRRLNNQSCPSRTLPAPRRSIKILVSKQQMLWLVGWLVGLSHVRCTSKLQNSPKSSQE